MVLLSVVMLDHVKIHLALSIVLATRVFLVMASNVLTTMNAVFYQSLTLLVVLKISNMVLIPAMKMLNVLIFPEIIIAHVSLGITEMASMVIVQMLTNVTLVIMTVMSRPPVIIYQALGIVLAMKATKEAVSTAIVLMSTNAISHLTHF